MFSKRYKALPQETKKLKNDTIENLIGTVKKNCTTNFDESIDVNFQLNLRQKKSETNLRTIINLPVGNNKKIKVAVICEFLTRYKKQQKAKPKKRAIQLEWLPEPKIDQKKERKDYERKYVSKFTKLQKTKLKIAALEQKLRLSQIEVEEPKIDRKKERKDYENEFLARYKKQQKAKPKKNVSKLLTPEPKTDRKKERKEYEKEYLSRLKNNL